MSIFDKAVPGFSSLFPDRDDERAQLGILGQWGTPQDNAIRNFGTQIQSPVVPNDTKLNFEKRILKPGSYPTIDNGDGSVSTHRMAYGGVDNGFVAYPTIVQKPDGKLVQLGDDEAFDFAMKNREYRMFDKESDAASYAEGGYKKFWGLGEKK
jgi:hypothetical protein